jgi:hypothetical protein
MNIEELRVVLKKHIDEFKDSIPTEEFTSLTSNIKKLVDMHYPKPPSNLEITKPDLLAYMLFISSTFYSQESEYKKNARL